MLLPLISAHLIVALVAPVLVARWGRQAFWVLTIPCIATVVWAVLVAPAVLAGEAVTQIVPWVPTIGLELAFRVDALSWLLTLVVSVVGALVLAYCTGYFDDDEPGLGRFAGCLTAFAGAMLGLVTSDDMLLLFVFWEFTTILSYLLIGHRPESRASRSAAMEALVVTTAGGLAMLVGIVLIGHQAGTYRLSEVLAQPRPGVLTAVGVALLLAGAVSKSALVPVHFWLPGAMAAPTPVSAYLHAAAMVKAGIYLVARLAPAYSDLLVWQVVVLALGGATMVTGALAALKQTDIKLILAYGTVSQLGFLVVLTGRGTPKSLLAGLTVLLAHALFKSALFLVVGAVDHATGTRDLRRLSGLGRRLPVLFGVAVVSAASMAGLPPMLGFVGKETAYGAFTAHLDDPIDAVVLTVLVVGSVLTLMYSMRFVRGTFSTKPGVTDTPLHQLKPVVTWAPAVAAVGTLVLGPLSSWIETPLLRHAALVGELPESAHLGLWHGVNLALMLSVLTWVAGFTGEYVLHRRHGVPIDARVPRTGLGQAGYRAAMRGLDRLSLETTGAVQRGSLPLSLGLIIVTYLAATGWAVAATGWRPDQVSWVWADSYAQAVTALVACAAAVAAVRSRRRLRAVFLTGVTGYASAYLFMLHGAPDLALTQVLVETVSVIVFVLVLRRLPGRFTDDPTTRTRFVRATLGTGVGLIAAILTFFMPAMRRSMPASTGMADVAYGYGGGTNIVNVILVDIRAWDTMGELSVVLVAATGIASLVFLREDNVAGARRKLGEVLSRRSDVRTPQASRWLSEVDALLPQRRAIVLEIVTRMVFHLLVVWSVFLLLSGHNAPGGGFAAGLVLGLALFLRYLAGGRQEVRAALPVMPAALLGIGLFLSASNAIGSMVFGGDVLQTWHTYLHIPLLGEIHVVSSVLFDVGVYFVVVGLMLDILHSLGSALDVQIEAAPGRSADDAPMHSDDHGGIVPAGEHVAHEHLTALGITHPDHPRDPGKEAR